MYHSAQMTKELVDMLPLKQTIRGLSKNSTSDILHNIKALINDDYILAQWYSGTKNWGDCLSPAIIEYYSKKKPLLYGLFPNIFNMPVYMAIGSILETCSDKNTIVWGTGFISKSGTLLTRPKKVCAVRGPRTRTLLLKQNVSCPKIFGDPALLFPNIYKPDVKKQYKLGIVPHYVDASSPTLYKLRNKEEIKIIDVTGDIYDFAQDICKCESIASSSLHGLIAADAYGVPSLWIKLSNNIIGNDFKYYDYYEAIGVSNTVPYHLAVAEDIEDIVDMCKKNEINLDLKELEESCPFLTIK